MNPDSGITKIHQISYHRNGVCGIGFYAVLFDAKVNTGDGERKQRMVGIVFNEPGECAVLAVEPLSDFEVGVKFGRNSWRGDVFERELRDAIEKADRLD